MFNKFLSLSLVFFGLGLFAISGIFASNNTKLESKSQITAVVGGTIIDGTGRDPIRDGIILIEENKIVDVGKKDQVVLPKSARKIDATGKYVIPGLMDANVHLCPSNLEFLARYEEQFEDVIEEVAQVTLKNGLTTVFDTWGPLQPLLNTRDKINRGETAGSRIYVAGSIVGFSGPLGRDFSVEAGKIAMKPFVERINAIWEENVGPDLGFMTANQVREEIRKYISRSIDFLKYGSSGHWNPYAQVLLFSEEVQKAIVDEAHSADITVQAHTTSNESLRIAIEAGVDLITHAGFTGYVPMPDSTISLLSKKQIPCGILLNTKKRHEQEMKNYALLGGSDPQILEVWRNNRLKLIKAGVPVLCSTDASSYDKDTRSQYQTFLSGEDTISLGDGHFVRCKAMVEMGMSPMDAILAATRNIAKAYNILEQLGTLEKGKLADLLILGNDPLTDINNLRDISIIIKDGQVVDRDKLPLKKIITQESVS